MQKVGVERQQIQQLLRHAEPSPNSGVLCGTWLTLGHVMFLSGPEV